MSPNHHHPIYYSLPLSHCSLLSPYYFPIIISSIMPFHSLLSPHHALAFPTIPCYHLVHPTLSFLTIFHHPIILPLSLVIPIVIRWWSFVISTKAPKKFLLIQNFYQDIQIKTSYKSMYHLEMSSRTTFQNMDLTTLGTT
jgi:hypothetical protein